MGSMMSTLMGWTAILALFSAYGYREWSKNQRRQIQPVRAVPQRPHRQDRQNTTGRRDQRENRGRRVPASDTSTRNSASAVATTVGPPPAQAPAATAIKHNVKHGSSSDDDVASNREFARQLASVKQGTKFTAKTKDETRQKSVKQSRAEERPSNGDTVTDPSSSTPSSTTGIDADDDRSSAASSVLDAVEAGDVDDMLEKKAPGPSVLRLTATEEKKSANQKKAKDASQPAETKKQRQNRKKAELAKVEREEAEKDRKQKLETQRRLARQAEGRAAKDGSTFVAAQAKENNAWSGGNSAHGVNGVGSVSAINGKSTIGGNEFIPVQPLDTFESSSLKVDTPKALAPPYDKNDDWMSTLPSEEEQMEMILKEEKDSWSTVTGKARKSKNKEVTVEPSKAPEPTAPVAKAFGPAVASENKRPAVVSKQSAFAALTPAEDVEEEWDV